MNGDDYTPNQTFKKGDRVELHPGAGLRKQGAKFGTVVGTSLTHDDAVKLELDKFPGMKWSTAKDQLRHVR